MLEPTAMAAREPGAVVALRRREAPYSYHTLVGRRQRYHPGALQILAHPRGRSQGNPLAASGTRKHRPTFPALFGSPGDARSACRAFLPRHDIENRHAGVGLLTPAVVHVGVTGQVTDERQLTLARDHEALHERLVRHPARFPAAPTAVWLNPPKPKEEPPQ